MGTSGQDSCQQGGFSGHMDTVVEGPNWLRDIIFATQIIAAVCESAVTRLDLRAFLLTTGTKYLT